MSEIRQTGLYAIVDWDLCSKRGIDVLALGQALLKAGPAFLQLRAKHTAPQHVLAALSALVQARRELSPSTLIFANDHAEIAMASGADGLHVGQTDESPLALRRKYPELLVGVSTHNREQLEAALALPLDYVALGPIFATSSKENPEQALGQELALELAQLAHAAWLPIVGIGGIDASRAQSLATGFDHLAFISALLPEELGPAWSAEVEARAISLGAAGSGRLSPCIPRRRLS